MKKLISIIMCVILAFLLILNISVVSANSTPPVTGINVVPDDCFYGDTVVDGTRISFSGNYDILVRLEDFETDNFTEMNNKYKAFYPFYENIEYLQDLDQGWTSYSAYYEESSSWGYSDYLCGMQFGNDKIVRKMEYVKLVYFDDEGSTIFISHQIEIPSVLFFQDRDAVISFNTETNQIDPHLDPYVDGYLILAVVLIGLYVIISVGVELLMAIVFKLRSKKAIFNILFINVITQGIMYIYFFLLFDGYRSDYQTHLYVYEALVVIIEFGYLYWRLKPISWQRLAFYVLLSNLVSYFIGIIRHL